VHTDSGRGAVLIEPPKSRPRDTGALLECGSQSSVFLHTAPNPTPFPSRPVSPSSLLIGVNELLVPTLHAGTRRDFAFRKACEQLSPLLRNAHRQQLTHYIRKEQLGACVHFDLGATALYPCVLEQFHSKARGYLF